MSRDGYVVVDDTHHPHFDEEDWPWVVNTTYPQPSPSDCSAVPVEQVRVSTAAGAVVTAASVSEDGLRLSWHLGV